MELLRVAIVVTIVRDAKNAGEDVAGVGFFCAGDEFGRALCDDATAAFASFGAKINDPVGLLDDVEVVLDDEHRVAEINEALQDVEEFSHVVKVQAGGGLVEDIESAAGLALGKFAGQFDALGFAAGKRGGGLAERDVAEADFDECRKFLLNLRNVFEKFQRVGGRQIQDITNGMAFVTHGERFRIVAAAAAHFTHHVNVGKKIHFDAAEAVSLAGFAAAAFYVEAEAPGAVAALARFRKHGEEIADRSEDAGVGSRIRAWGAADGGLIDFDDFVDLLGAENFAVCGGCFGGAIEFLREGAIENVVDERGLARAGNAGDDGEQPERKRDIDFFEIVRARTEDLNDFAIGAAALFGDGNLRDAAQILSGERLRGGFDLFWLALSDEIAASIARAGAEVDDEIGAADGVFVVLDDEDGIAEIAKMLERAKKARVVAGVETDAGFIKNVENAAQARADLRGQTDALRFTAGKRGGGAIQAEVAESHGEKEIDALGDFFERPRGDFFLALRELRDHLVHGGARGAKRERREISDGPAGELDGQRFGSKAFAVANTAKRRGHVLRHPLAVRVGAGFFEIAFEEFQDAGKTKTFFGLRFF